MHRIVYEAFGEAEVIHLARAPVPEPGPGEVRLRVTGAGLNPIDWKTRRGLGFAAQQIRDRLPWTPGYDVSGTVVALGEGVNRWNIGDRVCGLVGFPAVGGGYAEQVVAAEDSLCRVPESLDLIRMGALPLAGLTAWQGLFEQGALKPGAKILIHAGAGGVGHLAVQLAKAVDAHVIATASDENADFLAGLGADEVIDYQREDFVEVCYGLDLVLDLVGGEVGKRSVHTLGADGILVTVPTNTADEVKAEAEKQGVRAVSYTVRPDTEQLETMLEWAEVGDLQVHIEADYHLGDAAAAQRRLEDGHVRGKLILVPSQ
jgi:NADPH2:quinone reductase